MVVDKVYKCEVISHFEMKDDDGTFREHRYSLSSPEHNTVLGENDSDELFGDYESALEQANKNRSLIDILYVTKNCKSVTLFFTYFSSIFEPLPVIALFKSISVNLIF